MLNGKLSETQTFSGPLGFHYNQFLLYKLFLSCFVASCFREDLLICVFLSYLWSTASEPAGWPQTDITCLIPFHSGHVFLSHSHAVEGQVSRHCISRE
jgi:hypothetical protein